MTAPFLNPGFRGTDSDDNPLAGGYINFYAAGTTTPKAVYSEPYVDGSTPSLGTTVDLNSAGAPVSGADTPVLIYPGGTAGAYKMRIYDADDTLIFEFDDIPGYVAPTVASSSGLPEIPVDSKTTAYTVVVGDRGNLINCNPTGGAFAVTLPSAVTMGDNFIVGFRHNGTANQVSLVATGGQSIRGRKNVTSHVLANQGDIAWLISDGSDWIVAGSEKQAPPFFVVLDSLTAPPASPAAGARYRINGTPTGAWSTLGFADEDIVEADGNGSWIRYTPSSGWLLFDQDVEEYLKFTAGAWGALLVPPEASTLKTMIVQDQKASNTDGGTPTQDAWTTAVLNTSVINTITDASLASNKITLPGGAGGTAKRYRVSARKVFAVTGESRIRLKKDVAGTVMGLSESVHSGNIISTNSANAVVAVTAALECEFEISESTDFVLEYYVNVNQYTTTTQGLGIPSNISGTVEVYATVTIEDLSAQQGPQGDEGDPGEDGPPGALQYQFNTATSGDPGAGKILINNASPVSATALHVSETDANSADLSALVSIFDDSTSAKKALVLATKVGAPDNVMVFRITAAGTDQGDYWTFPIEYVAHDGSFGNTNDLAFVVIPTGDKGDPGDAAILNPVGAYDAGTEYELFDVVTDQGGSWVAKTTTTGNAPPTLPTTSNTQWLLLAERGPPGQDGLGTGDVVGPSGATNTAVALYDGTTGKLLKDSAFTVNGANAVVTDAGVMTLWIRRGSIQADNSTMARLFLQGLNDASAYVSYAGLIATMLSDAAGAETAELRLRSIQAGSEANRLHIGLGIYTPSVTGGDKGSNTINASEIYEANVRALTEGGGRTLTAGFAATSINDGTKSSGTFTPTFLGGNIRRYVNGGAHTLAPPTGEGSMVIQVTNNGSAGAITTSGFTKVSGDTITTTNGHDFFFDIRVVNGFSQLHVTALQ